MDLLKLNIQLFADGKVVIDTDLDNSGFSKGLDKMQSIAATGFKTVAASVGVVATALTGIVAAGVKSFADLEQNIGGIETLFKDNADAVIKNAEKAYQTAGLSANQYMSTVTSFSASLLQSLGNDTEAAAKYADTAIIDMADNANKMGTSMELIQNAYQGFAKQNYTMLDNLKLGYGGTKTEMERLIEDANRVKEANGEMADLSIDSFADITEAIHIIQTEMGITGTTSKEASETITGSMQAAKGAWDNFINGSGDIDQFVDSVVVAMQNISDAVVELAPNIIGGMVTLVEQLIPQIPPLLQSLLPVILEGATNLINGLVQIFPLLLEMIQENLSSVASGAIMIVEKILTTLFEMLPQILQMGITLLLELVQGIVYSLPELIPVIIDAVMLMNDTLLDNLDLIIDAGIELILALALGLIEATPKLIEKIPEIIAKLVTALLDPAMLLKLIGAALELIIALGTGLIKAIPTLMTMVPQIIEKLVEKLKEKIKNTDWKALGKNILNGILNGLIDFGNVVKDTIKKVGNKITNSIKDFFGIKSPSRLMRDEVGKYIADGIGVGFEQEIDSVYNDMQKALDLETGKMTANVQSSGTYQMAMAGLPTFNLLDNTNNTTQLVVNGKVLAEVVNTENRNREVAAS